MNKAKKDSTVFFLLALIVVLLFVCIMILDNKIGSNLKLINGTLDMLDRNINIWDNHLRIQHGFIYESDSAYIEIDTLARRIQ